MTAGITYYSDCRPDEAILAASRRTIERSGLPIVAVTLQPIVWPSARSIVLPLARGVLAMFRQILAGLEALDTEYVFFCEHDVLYHPSHFAEAPRAEPLAYNQHVYKLRTTDGHALHYRCSQTSGLSGSRALLCEHYRRRVELVERSGFSRAQGYEPGTHGRKERVDDLRASTWMSSAPNIDIRHDRNLTESRWRVDQFRNKRFTEGWTESDTIPGWGLATAIAQPLRAEACA